MAGLRKIRDLTIYRDKRYYCGPGPSAVLLPEGRIMVACRRALSWTEEGVFAHGFPSTEACLLDSDDGGVTWSSPRVFSCGNITNQNLALLRDGTLLCLTQRGEVVPLKVYERLKEKKPMQLDPHFGWAYASHGVQVLRSMDGGVSWEGPFYISPIPRIEAVLPGWPSPAGLRASPIELHQGGVGVAVYGLRGVQRRDASVWFMVSSDKGSTWQPRGCIVDQPDKQIYPNETGVYQCNSGKLVAFVRVENHSEGMLYTSSSLDGGHNWSPLERQPIKGHPFQAARLADGRVLLAYGYRHQPMGVRACLLDAECKDFDRAEEIVLRDDGDSFDLGYPHVLPLPDGTALVTYYHNTADGVRYVAGSVVAAEA
jgi:sialidase-1